MKRGIVNSQIKSLNAQNEEFKKELEISKLDFSNIEAQYNQGNIRTQIFGSNCEFLLHHAH